MNATTQLTRSTLQRTETKGFLSWLIGIEATWRQRKQLSELDTHAMRDLGLTDADIARETGNSVWNAPRHWTR